MQTRRATARVRLNAVARVVPQTMAAFNQPHAADGEAVVQRHQLQRQARDLDWRGLVLRVPLLQLEARSCVQ